MKIFKLYESIQSSEIINLCKSENIKSHIKFRMIDCLNTIFYKRLENDYLKFKSLQ